MGNMPLGLRQVADLMAEISFALVDTVYDQVIAALSGNTPATFQVASTVGLYIGALVVVGWQLPNAEVVSVLTVGETLFTANVLNGHVAGETIFGATFPCQQTTDPIFTQAEIQGYIAQAQNEFLTKVPLIFELFPNILVNQGDNFYTLPDTSIELERVAVQTIPPANFYPILTIARSASDVTAVLQNSVSAAEWSPGLAILVLGVGDTTFDSVSNSTFALTAVSQDGFTLNWAQSASDSTSTGGVVALPVQTRLYESSQNQIAMRDPNWAVNSGIPTNFFEDRTGVYGWGVAPVPDGNYYCELLTSVRGPEFLGLLEGFEVPDIFVPYIKYKSLEFCWSKAGCQRSPSLARWASSRYDFGVMLAERFLRNVVDKVGGNA